MKQVMNCHKDNGLLNMIRRTDPMISASLILGIYDHRLAIENNVTSLHHTAYEIGLSTRDVLGEFKGAYLPNVFIQVDNYNLTALFLCRFKTSSYTLFRHDAFAVTKTAVNGVFRIFVPQLDVVGIDNDICIWKGIENHVEMLGDGL